MRRRLHFQIYLTIVACLVLVAVLSSALWLGGGKERSERELVQVAQRLAALTLAPPGAPKAAQGEAASRLAEALGAELALYGPRDELYFATPQMDGSAPPPKNGRAWRRRNEGFVGALRLADGRRLIVSPPRRERPRPFLGLIAFIGVVTLGVAAGAYPFARRLTRRLEALQTGVERFGAGDLSARVDAAGRDEVAALAASFNAAAAEIERLTVARRLLLANASHELRTPLARVRLGAEMLEARPDPARFAALKRDLAEVDDLIEALLLSSRLDAAPDAVAREPVDLVALAAEEAARYDDCEVEGEAPETTGDPALLRRALRNLIDNAARHGAPPIRVVLGSDGTFATLRVEDAGPGFASEGASLIFEPFQRGRGKQNAAGYGLGLAIVRQITRAHGGDAEIDEGAAGGAVVMRIAAQAPD